MSLSQFSFSHLRISKAFREPLLLPLNCHTKYILFSDCHRGVGNANDNFLKNEYLYLASLDYYYRNGFTYLELGDGDELWENRSVRKIKEMHLQSFKAISRYYTAGRAYSVYGNHDIVKRKSRFPRTHFHTCYYDETLTECLFCPDITFYSGIILKDQLQQKDIYLLHGHQADLLNSTLWPLSRFLVRYIWRPLEKLGIPDPTSAAKNNRRKKKSEERLSKWAKDHRHILVTGHTHHPMTGDSASPYFNTGSCIHPAGITGIETQSRSLTLVKWSTQAREDLTLQVTREILGGPICVDEIY